MTGFDSALANVFYENLEGQTAKGDTWIRLNIRFGASSATALGRSTNVGILLIQVFYKKDTGGANKDNIVDALAGIYDYKTFTNSDEAIQFRGGTETLATTDGEYLHSQYSIPFDTYKEIA